MLPVAPWATRRNWDGGKRAIRRREETASFGRESLALLPANVHADAQVSSALKETSAGVVRSQPSWLLPAKSSA
jgi:hypothetical protein